MSPKHPSEKLPTSSYWIGTALLLLVAMPWLSGYAEDGLWPAAPREMTASLVSSIAAAALGLWVIALMRRERMLTRRHLAELERLTVTDPLTGLGNRRALERDLERSLLRSQRLSEPLALLYFDVDDLKRINDRGGHVAGDACLRTFGSVMRSTSRAGVDSGYRVGGDEFVMIAVADRLGAETLARRIRRTFSDRTSRHATLSLGVVVWDGSATAGQLLHEADRFMYRNKHVARRISEVGNLLEAAETDDSVLPLERARPPLIR